MAPPPKVTVFVPLSCEPLIVTVVPTLPLVGLIEPIVGPDGAGVTLKVAALDAVPPPVVTVIGPFVAPDGTVAVTCVSELTAKDALVPLNVTAVAPVNALPLIVTDEPTGPLAGLKPVIDGAAGGVTVPLQPGSWNDPMRVSQLSSAFVVGCAS